MMTKMQKVTWFGWYLEFGSCRFPDYDPSSEFRYSKWRKTWMPLVAGERIPVLTGSSFAPVQNISIWTVNIDCDRKMKIRSFPRRFSPLCSVNIYLPVITAYEIFLLGESDHVITDARIKYRVIIGNHFSTVSHRARRVSPRGVS